MKKALLFVMLLFPLAVSADDSGTCGENLTYTFIEATKTLTISGVGPMQDYVVSYPYDEAAPWFSYRANIKTVIIEEGVTSIGIEAFSCLGALTYIEIPNSVTSIGTNAFRVCIGLTSIVIPNSVTSIGNEAFSGCSSLLSIDFGTGVTTIGGCAFDRCSSLTDVVIPNNVTSIETGAFSGCSSLASVSISNSITSIGVYVFSGCSSLNNVTIPNSVITIKAGAFDGCSSLTNVIIPNSVVTIETGAFSGCSSLSSVNVPPSVVSIGSGAFYGTSWYDNQPDGLVYAGEVAYKYKGEMPENTCVTLKNGTVSIADYAFKECSNLSGITIPSSVLSIGNCAFYLCTGLTSVTIPEGVTNIEANAFYLCRGLTSVTIPNSVESIGQSAFDGCVNLTSVTVNIKTPLSITGTTFYQSDNAILYVPYGCKEAYSAAKYWKNFKEIVEMPPTEVDINIGSAGIATYCSEFDLDFTGTDVKAYIVSAFSPNTGKVILTRIYDVPANTGIVVIGDAGDHQIPIVEAQTIVSNMLVGVTEAKELNKVDGDYTNYVFAQKNGELGFYAVTDGSTLGAHKAYLPLPTAKLPSADSRVAYMFDGDDATEIQNIGQEDNVQHSIYNLNGQRQKGLKKGLNIVDGKKVLLK